MNGKLEINKMIYFISMHDVLKKIESCKIYVILCYSVLLKLM